MAKFAAMITRVTNEYQEVEFEAEDEAAAEDYLEGLTKALNRGDKPKGVSSHNWQENDIEHTWDELYEET